MCKFLTLKVEIWNRSTSLEVSVVFYFIARMQINISILINISFWISLRRIFCGTVQIVQWQIHCFHKLSNCPSLEYFLQSVHYEVTKLHKSLYNIYHLDVMMQKKIYERTFIEMKA